jgi:hypothetical protein
MARDTAALTGDEYRPFLAVLLPDGDLAAGKQQLLPLNALTAAWSATSPCSLPRNRSGGSPPPKPGLRQSHVIMAGWCGDTPRLAFSRPG